MALEKRTRLDKCEFVNESRTLQIRDVIEVLEDGEVISQKFHRRVETPCVMRDGEWVPNPLEDEGEYIRGIANAAWDDEARAAYIKETENRPMQAGPVVE